MVRIQPSLFLGLSLKGGLELSAQNQPWHRQPNLKIFHHSLEPTSTPAVNSIHSMKRVIFIFLSLLCSCSLFAQEVLPISSDIQETYNKGTRSISGRPGPGYWQNRSDYNLKINFNPATREIKGVADIIYYNNSPDTLKQLWFKLYPNLYKKGVERKSKIADADMGDGVSISAIQVNGQLKDLSSLLIEGTNMHTDIKDLPPGQSIKLNINYYYVLNEGSPVRTGQVDKGAFFVAYFFPRIAVYDDVDGWNKIPYTGLEEFYNDFGNFRANITVPKDFVVWATGDLLNSGKVLNKKIDKRLNLAEKTDAVVNVIDSTDLKSGNITHQRAFNTWKFEARNVTDFVFATSSHYVWQSSSLIVDSLTNRRTRVDAVFDQHHKDYYEWIDFTRKTVHAMSFYLPKWPFPYPHQTVFDGLDEMEYPMMVNANWVDDREYAIGLVDHEILHTIFPFYVGTNESKYAWMDEGWAVMGEWLVSSIIDSTIISRNGVKQYAEFSGDKNELPIITYTPRLDRSGYSFNSYLRPALGYLYIKDYLGDVLFNKALHHYITQWKGRHPMPFDFFNCMNEGSGMNLNWFWKRWFFENGITDMSIKAVNKGQHGYTIEIENKNLKPLPVDLTLSYLDGSVEKIHESIGVWKAEERIIRLNIRTNKTLQKVELGSLSVPDKNNADNLFIL